VSYEDRRKGFESVRVPGVEAASMEGRTAMTAHDDQQSGNHRPGGVLDPKWEDALRAGQDAEGGAGSVEAELAVAHLLRHARAPEVLGEQALASVWEQLESQLESARPSPWWRRGWVLWGGTVATAAAAAAILVIVWPGGSAQGPADPQPLVAAKSPAQTLERQFELLAPAARAQLGRTVDASRGSMRGDLLGLATNAGKTAGGAP
jgi:hypothetical protein